MKNLIIAMTLIPTISFASLYDCKGAGFTLNIVENPVEMKIAGNGFNTLVKNVNIAATFDTVITGNTPNPAASIKLTIKDSSFANPGESFVSTLQVSSGAGVKEFTNISCTRGND